MNVSEPGPLGASDALLAPWGATPPRPPVPRWLAAVQVFLVCGIPTQLVVFLALYVAGPPMGADGARISTRLSLEFFAMASLFDTALVALLIRIFLAISSETSQDVFLGRRPGLSEALLGLLLIPVLWFSVAVLVYGLTTLFPSLHNVETNPLAAYMDSPLKAGVFLVVVVLAGGVREELQRGFILHRFEQALGGARVGLALFTVIFGLLHYEQGLDAAIAVGVLGLVWGVIYIRRGSVVAPMVSHAGFDAAQVLQQLLLKTIST